ncbi:hypothetical protein B566_EDAN000645 [Ephemera danica]|nr:hypothetical protein B566_EDAN000645 [Ephemera danica]
MGDQKAVERELLVSRTTVDTLQAKVAILERGNMQRAGETHMDSLLKSLQDRHRKEVTSLQQQLDARTSKLENMERALKEAEQRVWEETRRHENMLMEKSEAINRLNRALEESQRHCQELVTAQQQQQQPSLLSALSDKKQLEDKVARLQAELEWAKADVDQLETLVGLGVLSCNDSEWLEKGTKKSGVLSSMEGLRDELARSLRNQEAKRIEIKRLVQELGEKEQDIKEMKQQEGKFQQVVNTLKEESEKLIDQLKQQQLSQCDDATFKKLRQENVQLCQCISELKHQALEMQEQMFKLEEQNAALAEQSVELQRAAEEDKHQTLDNHTKEYLAFHQRAVASARQQEREQAEKELAELRLELELEKKNADAVKTAYVSVSQAKVNALAELEELKIKLQQNLSESKRQDKHAGENEQQLQMQYEQKVAAEVQRAKQSVLREVEQERQVILEDARRETEKKIEERLASAKAEWETTQTPVQLVGDDKLREEISRLKKMLQNQAEALKKERQLAEEQVWSHFQEELQRVTENPVTSKHVECRDRATSPIASLERAASNSPSDTLDSDLEKQVQMLQLLLEDTKSKHASKLADLQTHLQEKHQEMEDFKKKVIEFTKMRDETQEKDSMKYINTLKQEIASLTAELSENKKVSDTERTQLKIMIESWTVELQGLKTDKKNAESKQAILQKKLGLLQEKHTQLKDYYERRETYIRHEHKKREEKFFETLIKLKTEIDSLSHLQFPKFSNLSEQPTKDV